MNSIILNTIFNLGLRITRLDNDDSYVIKGGAETITLFRNMYYAQIQIIGYCTDFNDNKGDEAMFAFKIMA